MAFEFNFKERHINELLPTNNESAEWYNAFVNILPHYDITTPKRVAAFIAQCAHESNEFHWMEENLNYSATALDKIFGKYFIRAGRDAWDYHRQPERIANIVYASRMGNGNTTSGDGWKFRGRGAIQLTGRNNYTKFADSLTLSLDHAIQYLTTKRGAVEAAAWFWQENDLNKYADTLDIVRMTKRINGGTNGLADRKEHFEHALEVFGVINHQPTVLILRTVRRGDRNETVKLVQRALGLHDDGIFGRGTERAVKRWQKQHGLLVDGIVGKNSMTALLK